MKRYKITYLLASLSLIIFFNSCTKDSIDPGGTSTKAMANEWWVQLDGKGTYSHFSTYNTSSNSSTEMILDDLESFWGNSKDGRVAAKINVNLANQTFSVANSPNVNTNYPITFTVTDGKILTNAAKSPGAKAVTDSIAFKIEFSDDPGTIYNFSGYARTRFPQDDH
jgi:hypothetical protein